jgi:hypothetical protein
LPRRRRGRKVRSEPTARSRTGRVGAAAARQPQARVIRRGPGPRRVPAACVAISTQALRLAPVASGLGLAFLAARKRPVRESFPVRASTAACRPAEANRRRRAPADRRFRSEVAAAVRSVATRASAELPVADRRRAASARRRVSAVAPAAARRAFAPILVAQRPVSVAAPAEARPASAQAPAARRRAPVATQAAAGRVPRRFNRGAAAEQAHSAAAGEAGPAEARVLIAGAIAAAGGVVAVRKMEAVTRTAS